MGEKIGHSIYNYTIDCMKKNNKITIDDFKFYMREKSRNIKNNINPSFNLIFSNKVKNGDIDLNNIAFIEREEMYPERWTKYVEKKRLNLHFQFEEEKSIVTDMFTCMTCIKNNNIDSKRCSYYKLQIRSCDEPETCFVTCLNCHKKWKQEG